jgi:predicted RNA-binding Zn ribbon-like protein
MGSDWRNGSLFVGNALALDFLNTRPVMKGEPHEMLPDGEALATWLAAAGLVRGGQVARLSRRWKGTRGVAAIQKLHRLRENLRRVVLLMESGHAPPASFVEDLNRLLAAYPGVKQVVVSRSGLEHHTEFALEQPEQALGPIANAIADLLTGVDVSRLRKCQGCVLHFCDTSKKGTRIWCSMNLCGNRSKVAAFADRKRAERKADDVPEQMRSP